MIRRRRPTLPPLPSKARGFTMVEILVAMVFMAIVMPIAVQGVLVANRLGTVAQRKRVAARLAENLLTDLALTNDWTDRAQNDVFEDYPGYRWEMESEEWEQDPDNDELFLVTVIVFFQVQEREFEVRLSTVAVDLEAKAEREEEEAAEQEAEQEANAA